MLCSTAHLRPVRADDAPEVLTAFRSAPDMARQGDVRDLAGARAQVAWLCGDRMRGTAICRADGSLVGAVAVAIDGPNRSGWVSYWLHAEHRGSGLVARATATVADRALRAESDGGWGLERLELGHRVDNPASGGVARAAGFVREGIEREKFLIAGQRVDVLTYGRLRSDPAPPPYRALPWTEHPSAGQ